MLPTRQGKRPGPWHHVAEKLLVQTPSANRNQSIPNLLDRSSPRLFACKLDSAFGSLTFLARQPGTAGMAKEDCDECLRVKLDRRFCLMLLMATRHQSARCTATGRALSGSPSHEVLTAVPVPGSSSMTPSGEGSLCRLPNSIAAAT